MDTVFIMFYTLYTRLCPLYYILTTLWIILIIRMSLLYISVTLALMIWIALYASGDDKGDDAIGASESFTPKTYALFQATRS